MMHDAQHGLHSGRGCRRLELARARANPAFVDFSKAFDSVNYEVLWAALEARGASTPS